MNKRKDEVFMIKIRQCELKDIDNVARLSKKVLKNLQQKVNPICLEGLMSQKLRLQWNFHQQ